MCASSYTFTGEADSFDIDDFIAHLGWNGPKFNTFKIHHQEHILFLSDIDENDALQFNAKKPQQGRKYGAFTADPNA